MLEYEVTRKNSLTMLIVTQFNLVLGQLYPRGHTYEQEFAELEADFGILKDMLLLVVERMYGSYVQRTLPWIKPNRVKYESCRIVESLASKAGLTL
jgi:hypothetical protein